LTNESVEVLEVFKGGGERETGPSTRVILQSETDPWESSDTVCTIPT
jgi:hypothetical protein